MHERTGSTNSDHPEPSPWLTPDRAAASDMAYHQLKTTGALWRIEDERARRAEFQADFQLRAQGYAA